MTKGFPTHSLTSKRRSSASNRDGKLSTYSSSQWKKYSHKKSRRVFHFSSFSTSNMCNLGPGLIPSGASKRDNKAVKRSSPHLQSRRVYFISPQSNQNCALSVTEKALCEKNGSSCTNESMSPPSGGKASSRKGRSSQRWKNIILKRLRAKDNKILSFLQSRPPPPTVGLSCLVDTSGDNFGETTIPEPYTHLFDQFDNNNSSLPHDAGVEVDADEEMQPVENISSPYTTSPHTSLPLSRSTSIDLFGSYWQDYKQSDYVSNNLFDENMLIC